MNENKKAKKVVALLLCAVLLVVGSVTGTMAYLTSTASVENTFTVGKVVITLDETNVDNDNYDGSIPDRDKQNDYKLIPGKNYKKDPIIHVEAGSEACYLFVKVENGLVKDIDGTSVNIESADYTTIAEQLEENDWTTLSDNIYYQNIAETGGNGESYVVFSEFEIADNITNETLANFADAEINVTAYAVQVDGFDSARAAWSATFGAQANS